VREVTDASFETDVLAAARPVVVDFWAPWCGPCKGVTKALEQLEEELAQFEFVAVDIDANPIVASRYDVLSLPTVILFSGGEAAETVVGARGADHFRRTFAPYQVARA
jgi:thioredoxin 1